MKQAELRALVETWRSDGSDVDWARDLDFSAAEKMSCAMDAGEVGGFTLEPERKLPMKPQRELTH